MGEVYRAKDPRLGREVAIKVLPAELASDASRLKRFEQEARSASALNHPNIVTIYDIGTTDSISWIAMERVEGKTLREQLSSAPLPIKRLLQTATQIAGGLARAHEVGIVHRDLKPENVMVTKDGLVKILDFGLAKLTQTGPSAEGKHQPTEIGTTPGVVMGTVGYMSPEQASGEPVDFRSDQFSLGSILYEMITGKRAFECPTPAQTLSAIIESEPGALATVTPKTPTNLVWVVERCLSKDPEDRYGSTRDLARDLAAQRDHPSGILVSGVEPPTSRRVRLSRPVLAAVALAVAGVAVLAFLSGQRVQARHDRERPPPARVALTFRRGFLTGARFAPDGHAIVYSAAWDGKPSEIFTTRVGSTESRSLGIFPAGILAISSAGEMAISLGCENRWDPCFGTLARVPLAGGAPREILENVGSADWSPNGKDLAVIHAVEGRYRLEYPIGQVLYEAEGLLSSVRVSPKGDLVAFLDLPSRDSGRGVVSVVGRSGGKRVLTREWAYARPILWSPAGDEVFFARRVGREVRAVDLSGRTRSASWIPGLDDVSREGIFLDANALDNLRRVILAVVPGTLKERNLSWLMDSTAADLSADGRQLLFYEYSNDPERPGEEVFTTYLRKTDGSDAKMLGEGKALALSADEKWALVAQLSPQPHLALLPTGAGEPRLLTGGDIQHYHWASFFPDSRRILFAAEEKGKAPRSYIQDLDGGPPKPFAEEGLRATLVSPDGRWIAGSTLEGLHLIYPADGEGRPRPIEGALPEDFLVQWSSDGRAMYVRGGEEQPLVLYRIDLGTGRRERWKELAPPDLAGFLEYGSGPRGIRVTPDGRFYAYTYFTIVTSRLTLTDVGPNWWK
jgi:dipeptidyl aminopeptidase/acylaminoacyl peptidase